MGLWIGAAALSATLVFGGSKLVFMETVYADTANEEDFEIDENRVLISYKGNAEEIAVPAEVKSIGNYAFANCSSLTSITLPEGLTSIEDYAFGYCSGLTDITLPQTLTKMEIGVFFNCSSNSYAHTYALENNIPFRTAAKIYTQYKKVSDNNYTVRLIAETEIPALTAWKRVGFRCSKI